MVKFSASVPQCNCSSMPQLVILSVTQCLISFVPQCLSASKTQCLSVLYTLPNNNLPWAFLSLTRQLSPHWIGPLGQFSRRVCPSVCLCVHLSIFLWRRKTPTSRGHGDLWFKGVSLILACDDTILVFPLSQWFFIFIKASLLCIIGELAGGGGGGGSVAVAVGVSDRCQTTYDTALFSLSPKYIYIFFF